MRKPLRIHKTWLIALAITIIALGTLISVLVFATGDSRLTVTGYSDVIRFQAEGVATLQVRIFDLSGREIWDSGIVSGWTVDWDRRNDTGERLAYGAYIYSAQGWNASGDLNFQKNGKLALMPGDKVQLQAAPVVLPSPSDTAAPYSASDGRLLAPMAHTPGTSTFDQVGIGTTSPSFALHVVNPGGAAYIAATDTPAGITYLMGTSIAGEAFIGTLTNHDFDIRSGNTRGRIHIAASTGNVGIGTTTPLSTLSVAGTVRTTYADYVPDFRSGTGDLDLWGAQDVYIVPANGYCTYVREDLHLYDHSECWFAMNCMAGSGRTWGFESSDDGYFEIWDWDYGNYVAWFSPGSHSLWVRGNLSCSGTKSFVIPHPDQPGKEIVYTTLEGPEVGIYVRGTTILFGGQAVISIPEHFGAIVVEDSITVQLTPRGTWLQLYVVSATTNQIIVGEATGHSGNFDYLIQGIRQGYEDFEPVQDASEVTSRRDAGASIPLPPSADKPENTAADEKVD